MFLRSGCRHGPRWCGVVFTFRAVCSQAKRLPAVGGGYFEVGIGGREFG